MQQYTVIFLFTFIFVKQTWDLISINEIYLITSIITVFSAAFSIILKSYTAPFIIPETFNISTFVFTLS